MPTPKNRSGPKRSMDAGAKSKSIVLDPDVLEWYRVEAHRLSSRPAIVMRQVLTDKARRALERSRP